MIVKYIASKYKLQNLETKDILNKLYGPRNLVQVTDVDEINKVIKDVKEIEPIKYIGATPVRKRKKK
jgi:hypothetical protein